MAGLGDLLMVKRIYDQALRSDYYADFESAVITFFGVPTIASTGCVHVDFDLHGHRLQDLERDPSPMHGINFGVIKTTNGCAFVATWPKQYKSCALFIESLLNRNPSEVPSLLIKFYFAYVENTYFSEKWWNELPPENTQHLTQLAGTKCQYGAPLEKSGLRHTEMEVRGIARS